MAGTGGGFVGYGFTSSDSSSFAQFAYPTVGAGLGLIVGFVVVFGLIFCWNLFRAPYRQRNELAIQLEEANRRLTVGEQEKHEEFSFEFDNISFTGTDQYNRLILGVMFFSRSAVIVERLYLDVGGNRIQPLNWAQFKLKSFHRDNYQFDLAEIRTMLPTGTNDAQFVSIVDGQEHRSRPFDIRTLL